MPVTILYCSENVDIKIVADVPLKSESHELFFFLTYLAKILVQKISVSLANAVE